MKSGNKQWKQLTGWAKLEGQWLRRKHFSAAALARIAQHITASERRHTGELMLAVEGATPVHETDSHLRALEVFGRLRAWDTPLNTGVLLYLALDKRRIHIIADRGIAAHDSAWADICAQLESRFQQGEFIDGVMAAIDAIEKVLLVSCPPLPQDGVKGNDLPDAPVML